LKPYGVKVIQSPDVADIQAMGAKSSTGKFPGKSGDFHPYSRTKNKKAIRQYWKSKARHQKIDLED
jgi:hypothetical protein